MTQLDAPVLIAGAGAVGLALACELRRHGVPVRIVDKREGTTPWSKALVVHARTMEIFERMGVIDEALARGRPTHGALMRAFGQEILHIDLGALDAPYNFFLDINQSDTESILETHLNALGASVEWRTELSDVAPGHDQVKVRLMRRDGTLEKAEFRYLCACDGAHSFVRHALDLPFPGAPYEAQFFLADVKLDWDRSPERLYADIQPEGLFFAAPLKEDGRWRVITELPRHMDKLPDTLARGENPNEDDLRDLMRRMAPEGTQAYDPAWLSWFKVSHRILDDFRHGRVFFVGDAAHIHAPVGGQGMNIGIHDAFNLGWKLALVVQGRASDALLDSYSVERRPAAAGVVDITDTIIAAALSKGPFGRLASQAAARVVDNLPPLKNALERVLSEIATNYRGSPIVAEGGGLLRQPPGQMPSGVLQRLSFRKGPQAGDRAPDAQVRRSDGSLVRLHECFTGTGFHILRFTGGQAGDLDRDQLSGAELLRRVREVLAEGVTLVEIGSVASRDAPGHVHLLDHRGTARRAYGAAGACLYLVRPDGYIGFRSQPADTDGLIEHVRELLAPSRPRAASPVACLIGGPATGRALALAGVFAAAGTAKLLSAPKVQAAFEGYGYPQTFMYAVGAWEVSGAAALVSNRTRLIGAAALTALCVGAVGTHVIAREPAKSIPAVVLLGLAASVIMSARKQRRGASSATAWTR